MATTTQSIDDHEYLVEIIGVKLHHLQYLGLRERMEAIPVDQYHNVCEVLRLFLTAKIPLETQVRLRIFLMRLLPGVMESFRRVVFYLASCEHATALPVRAFWLCRPEHVSKFKHGTKHLPDLKRLEELHGTP